MEYLWKQDRRETLSITKTSGICDSTGIMIIGETKPDQPEPTSRNTSSCSTTSLKIHQWYSPPYQRIQNTGGRPGLVTFPVKYPSKRTILPKSVGAYWKHRSDKTSPSAHCMQTYAPACRKKQNQEHQGG